MNWKLICHLLLATLCVSLSGCGTIPSYESLGGGYVEATYTRTSWEQPATRFELQYKKGLRKIVIWPSMYPVGEIAKDDMVVFVANKAYEPPYPGDPRATRPRLFAVKAPESPVDITDEIVGRWAQSSGKDISKALKAAWIIRLRTQGNDATFSFEFAGVDWPEMGTTLDWNKVSEIMRDVKEHGVVRKDRVWGTSYIEKEFKPDVQK